MVCEQPVRVLGQVRRFPDSTVSGFVRHQAMYVLHYAPDNASLIIRLALEELGAPYRTALVDRRVGDQRSPAFLEKNPNGLIPALETPDGVLFETGAALLWLCDRHGGLAPVPHSSARGDFLKWLFFCSNTLHANLRGLFYPQYFVGPDHAAQKCLTAQLQDNLIHDFGIIDKCLPETPDVDALDLYVAACLRWAQIYGPEDRNWADLAKWPRLLARILRLEARPSVAALVKAEGLGARPFTRPHRPTPPEGSAQ